MNPLRCPNCGQSVARDQRFCGACGSQAGEAIAMAATATSIPHGDTSPAGHEPDDAGRFAAGTVIAGRYRIVGLLGRGGMGEVYRADDLKLARPVALKFLPRRVEGDPGRLDRLLNEVRTALSVSHPNVCRVHDIQQEAGRHFITMEFVDGDDLSGLLKRIGRLPKDKALEISRQLCAGLGAAHSAGVLHRDLKPANIMLDGRGQVKITDFGLAGLAGGFQGEEVRAGTPAYMSPEQLAGKEVTEASDIYALGLVLYEIYTGKPAYESSSLAEMLRLRTSAPTIPSSHVTDIDPAVERVILRCLEADPAGRPGSALAVSAALPGGDPLADALAAGETPSPQLVAEAGAVGGLKPWVATALLAGFVVMSLWSVTANRRLIPVSRADLPKSGAVLEDRARGILQTLGYDSPPRDSIYDFSLNRDYLNHLQTDVPAAEALDAVADVQPALFQFGYRQSSDWIRYESLGSVFGWVTRSPPTRPGDARLLLDPTGRLVWLDIVPPEVVPEGHDAKRAATDWDALIDAAGFTMADLRQADPQWWPRRAFDERRAWEGAYPDAPDVPVRIEAASLAGRPVAFRIVEPWTRPEEARPPPSFSGEDSPLQATLGTAIWTLTLVGVAFLAWRNLRLGRGDRRTAFRFALALTALRLAWYIATHHYPSVIETRQLTGHLAYAMYRFGLAYAFYLALEPYARKLWPHMLTSWVRLFDGRFRDPLVGRDLLVGVTFATLVAGMDFGMRSIQVRLGQPMLLTVDTWALESLRGLRGAMLGFIVPLTEAMIGTFMIVMIVLVSRLVLRRDWLVVVPLAAIGTGFQLGSMPLMVALPSSLLFIAVVWVSLFRFGLVTFVAVLTLSELFRLPLTLDLGAWWSTPTWLVLISLSALAVASFRSALAGQPVFRGGLAEG